MSNRTVCNNSKNENRFVPLCLRGRNKLGSIVIKPIKKSGNICRFLLFSKHSLLVDYNFFTAGF